MNRKLQSIAQDYQHAEFKIFRVFVGAQRYDQTHITCQPSRCALSVPAGRLGGDQPPGRSFTVGATGYTTVLLRPYNGATRYSTVLLRPYNGATRYSPVLLRPYNNAKNASAGEGGADDK
jgi:hypothetical protein